MTFADQRGPNRKTKFVGVGGGHWRLNAKPENKTGHQLDVCDGDAVRTGHFQLVDGQIGSDGRKARSRAVDGQIRLIHSDLTLHGGSWW